MPSENLVTNVPANALINIVSIGGDLTIDADSNSEIRAKGDNPKLSVENDGQRVNITCSGDCRLRVPQNVSVVVGNVSGDAKIKGVSGNVSVQSVGGDLSLRDTGALRMGSTGGDLKLKRIDGSVQVTSVGGDLHVREVDGDLHIENASSDALISRVRGNCEVLDIGSDLILNLEFQVGQRYQFGVANDAMVQLQSGSNVTLQLPADTEVNPRIPNVQVSENDDHTQVVVGSGAAQVIFTEIGNELQLVSAGKNDDDSFELDINLPDDFNDMINARIHEQISHLREQIEAGAERIRRNAERHSDRARGNAKRNTGEFRWDWSWPEKRKRGEANFGFEKAKHDKASEPVSDQERLEVLRMVENKQITVEEAERLLAALEGRD